MNSKKGNRYETIGFIMISVLMVLSFMRSNSNHRNSTFLMDMYESKINLSVTLDYALAEEGTYTSKMFETNNIMLSDSFSRSVYLFDLADKKAEKTLDYPGFGIDYRYGGNIYILYDRYLEKVDSDYEVVSKRRIFPDAVYSRAYSDNIAIVSLYRSEGIYAFDLATNEFLWQITDENRIGNHIKLNVVDNILYYLNGGKIYGLSPQTGEVLIEIDGGHYQPYLIDGNYMYTSGYTLKRVDMGSWETLSETKTYSKSIKTDEDSLYIVDLKDGSYLKKYDKLSLELQWSTNIFDGVGRYVELMDDYVIVDNVIGQVALINKENGSVDWVKQFQSDTGAFGYNNTLVIVESEGKIQYYDLKESELD